MTEPPPSATCARCGTWNPPAASRCSACAADLRATPDDRPRDGGADRTARLVGLALMAGSAVVIAAMLPVVLGGAGRAPDASAIALASPQLVTPSPSVAPTGHPTSSPSRSASPSAPGPTAGPSPTPEPDDPGGDADNALGGGAPQASQAPERTAAPDAPGTVALPSISVDISGATKISYFGISGRAPDDLVRSMTRNAAEHCESREALACVALRPDIQPTYRITSAGACLLTGATTSLRATVYMPRWIKPTRVHPELVAWWRTVLDHIAWHEGRHIRIEKAWLEKAPAMFEGKACSSGQRVATRWARKVAEAQAAFDAKDYAAYELPPYDGPGGFFGN
jgi:predicted secreted Zn-dependent protease